MADDDVEEVLDFLISRNVNQDVVERFRMEKMDCSAIDCTPENVLEEMGLARKGDIYALKAMCSQKAKSKGSEERESRKRKLVEEILKEKQDKQRRKSTGLSTSSSASSSEATSSTTRAPKCRRIALGLMQFNETKNRFVTVRYAKGGGSRTLDVPVTTTKQELIEMSKDVFFEGGFSPIGKASDFTFDLANFKGEPINKLRDSDGQEKPFTIQGYFETYKLTRVQLYLTCRRCEDSDVEVLMTSVFGPSTSNSQSSKTSHNKGKTWRQHLNAQLENDRKLWRKLKMEQDEEYQECLEVDRRKQAALETEIGKVSQLEGLRSAKAARVPVEPESGTPRVLMVAQHPSQGRVTRFFSSSDKMVAVYDWLGSLDLHPEHFSLHVQPATTISPEEGVFGYEGVVMYMRALDEPLLLSTSSPEISFRGFGTGTGEIATDDHDYENPPPLAIDPVTESLPQQIMELDEERSPVQQQPASLPHEVDDLCYVHRSRLKDDVIAVFKNQDSLHRISSFRIIDERGNVEEGVGSGVTRDVIATFWQQLFAATMVGDREKVPCIRHDFQKSEWTAIGRVLVFGFKEVNYIPIGVSKAFVASCIFGEESLTDEFLLSSFRLYITSEERETYDNIKRGHCESDDDDVLEFLGNYKTFTMPTKRNIDSILSELAHQELIQKPRYVAECWAPVLAELKQYPEFSSPSGLEDFFSAKMPSAKKTVRVLQSQPENEAESQCLDYLKKFIRSLNAPALGTFLKFTTGSDILPERLEVSFTSMDGFSRRPIAHTCGPLLELPRTYRSYSELAEEFTSLLRERGAWGFNIV